MSIGLPPLFFWGYAPIKGVGGFLKEKFSRLKKLRLLLVSLKIQRSSKVNSSDNNLNF
jgi:hypothetical protein